MRRDLIDRLNAARMEVYASTEDGQPMYSRRLPDAFRALADALVEIGVDAAGLDDTSLTS